MQLNPDEVRRRGLCRPNIDVYSVAGNGAALGDYTLSTTLTVADSVWNDGRDGMAVSPTDPSRAVIVETDPSGNPLAQRVTGLPLAPSGFDVGELAPEALTLPTGATPYAVAINGDNAFVQTSSGIVTLSGVTSGQLSSRRFGLRSGAHQPAARRQRVFVGSRRGHRRRDPRRPTTISFRCISAARDKESYRE